MSYRTPITLLVLLGILLGAAYFGWHTVISPVTTTQADTTPTPPATTCLAHQAFHKGQVIKAGDILVNVFNAGTISGLAGDALSALHDKGFRAGVAANPPGSLTARNVTILTNTPRSPEVKLVRRQFIGLVALRPGPDLDPGIDIIIGQAFKGVSHKAKTTLRLPHAVRICTKLVPTLPS